MSSIQSDEPKISPTFRRRPAPPRGLVAGTTMSGIALGGLAGAAVAGPVGAVVGMVVGGATGAALERQFPTAPKDGSKSSQNGTAPHES